MKDLSKSHLSLDFLIFLFKVLFTAKARKEREIHFFFVTEWNPIWVPAEILPDHSFSDSLLKQAIWRPSFFCYAESLDKISLPFSCSGKAGRVEMLRNDSLRSTHLWESYSCHQEERSDRARPCRVRHTPPEGQLWLNAEVRPYKSTLLLLTNDSSFFCFFLFF